MAGLLGTGLLAACTNDRGPHPELPRVGVVANFSSRNLCSDGVSPAIRVLSAPVGTANYRIKMTMVNALIAPSWQFDVAASRADTLIGPSASGTRDQVIREGAIPDFPTPCPPDEQLSFVYRLEVMAMAGDGRPVGYGWGFVPAQALVRQLYVERNLRLREQKARDDAAAKGLPPPPDSTVATPRPRLDLPYTVGAGYPVETTAFFFVY